MGEGTRQASRESRDILIPTLVLGAARRACTCCPRGIVVVQELSHVQLFVIHRLQPTRLLCPWNFPGKNTGVGCHFLLWGIFLTQGSNLCLLHWQTDCLPLSQQRIKYMNVQEKNAFTCCWTLKCYERVLSSKSKKWYRFPFVFI